MTDSKNTVLGNGDPKARNGTHAERDPDIDRGAQAVGRAKFDMGTGNVPLPTDQIPWGYGEDRVTVMARDPDWLYVYWEITDEGMADARRRLGQSGLDAWCNLRVYETTSRVFDGTNANSYFDIAIERSSRDWFVHVGKPESTCHVEVGMKSRDGYFQPIARSGRADFPSKRPTNELHAEWLTVHEAIEAPEPPTVAPYQSKFEGPEPELPPEAPDTVPSWVQDRRLTSFRTGVVRHTDLRSSWRTTWAAHESSGWTTSVSHRYEVQRLAIPWMAASWRTEWQGDGRAFAWFGPLHQLTWSGPLESFSWDLGPYPGDAAAPGRVVVRYVGDTKVVVDEGGRQLIVHGPWEVTIRGFDGAASARRIIGSWVLHWVQPSSSTSQRWETLERRAWFDTLVRQGFLQGASESQLWSLGSGSEEWMLGASELLMLGGSELLLIGASELGMLGASELSLGGASERSDTWQQPWLGASELSWQAVEALAARGASERLVVGASEWTSWSGQSDVRGGEAYAVASSELLVAGAWMGASERMGSSEWVKLGELIGASEWMGAGERLGASEQSVYGPGASEQLHPSYGDQGGADSADRRAMGQAFRSDASSDAFTPGASEQVAAARYPDSLDDDPSDQGGA